MGKTPLEPLQFSQFVSWCLAWNYERLFSDSFYILTHFTMALFHTVFKDYFSRAKSTTFSEASTNMTPYSKSSWWKVCWCTQWLGAEWKCSLNNWELWAFWVGGGRKARERCMYNNSLCRQHYKADCSLNCFPAKLSFDKAGKIALT